MTVTISVNSNGIEMTILYAPDSEGVVVPASLDLSSSSNRKALATAQRICAVFSFTCRFHMNRDETLETGSSGETLINHAVTARHWIKVYETYLCENVADYLEGEIEVYEAMGKAKLDSQDNRSGDAGYVYLISSPHGYKIGKSRTPKKRYSVLKVAMPFSTRVVCVIETYKMSQLERDLHQRFDDKRINGEWFNLNDADVTYILGLI